MRYLVGAARIALIGIFIVLILIVIAFFPIIGDRGRVRAIKCLAGALPGVLGLRTDIRGEVPDRGAAERGRADTGIGYLVCCNHVSFADIFFLNHIIPSRFIAKKEIASWPVMGLIAKAVGTLFIDRSRKRAVLEIANVMAGALSEGRNVLFFPEGTTSNGLQLLPFHANLFAAATETGAPVLPITIRYVYKGKTTDLASYAKVSLWTAMKRIVTTPGITAEVTILPPILSQGRDRHELCAEASAVMAAALGMPDATAEKEKERRERFAALEREQAGQKTPA
jgi:1-acyl-sn-glycerol-3-phosphate acyltransferase